MTAFALPDLGEGLQEAEIVAWHVAEGDHVVADQPLVSVETEKAVVEIPSPRSGRIARLVREAGRRRSRSATPLVEFEEGPRADAGTVVGDRGRRRAGGRSSSRRPRDPGRAGPCAASSGRPRAVTGTGPGGAITPPIVERAAGSVGCRLGAARAAYAARWRSNGPLRGRGRSRDRHRRGGRRRLAAAEDVTVRLVRAVGGGMRRGARAQRLVRRPLRWRGGSTSASTSAWPSTRRTACSCRCCATRPVPRRPRSARPSTRLEAAVSEPHDRARGPARPDDHALELRHARRASTPRCRSCRPRSRSSARVGSPRAPSPSMSGGCRPPRPAAVAHVRPPGGDGRRGGAVSRGGDLGPEPAGRLRAGQRTGGEGMTDVLARPTSSVPTSCSRSTVTRSACARSSWSTTSRAGPRSAGSGWPPTWTPSRHAGLPAR